MNFEVVRSARLKRYTRGDYLTSRNVLERKGVFREIGRIRKATNPEITAVSECCRRIHTRRIDTIESISFAYALHHTHEVAPAFALAAGLLRRTVCEAMVDVMPPFMAGNAIVNGAIPRDVIRCSDHRGLQRAHHERGFHLVAHCLRDALRSDINRHGRRSAHGTRRRAIRRIVGNDDANGVIALRIKDFISERTTTTTIDERDFTR